MFLKGDEGRGRQDNNYKGVNKLPNRCASILGAEERFRDNLQRGKTKMSLVVE